jgi:hypothetical protein
MKITVDTDHLYNTGDPDLIWAKTAVSRAEKWFGRIVIGWLMMTIATILLTIGFYSGRFQRPLHYSYIFVPTSHDSLLAWTQYQSFSEIRPDSVIILMKQAIKEKRK